MSLQQWNSVDQAASSFKKINCFNDWDYHTKIYTTFLIFKYQLFEFTDNVLYVVCDRYHCLDMQLPETYSGMVTEV